MDRLFTILFDLIIRVHGRKGQRISKGAGPYLGPGTVAGTPEYTTTHMMMFHDHHLVHVLKRARSEKYEDITLTPLEQW
jgi:hypothetical protein